jgi:hypothetical protein
MEIEVATEWFYLADADIDSAKLLGVPWVESSINR